MMQYPIDKGTKIVLLTILKNGFYSTGQRSKLAKAFGLFEDRITYIKGQELEKETINELIKRL